MEPASASKTSSPSATSKTVKFDHNYQMETSGPSMKRKSSNTPTKVAVPPNKVIVADTNEEADLSLFKAINKLTENSDDFYVHLTKNSVMIAWRISKLADINAADVKDCKTSLKALEKTVPSVTKETKRLRERVLELERY